MASRYSQPDVDGHFEGPIHVDLVVLGLFKSHRWVLPKTRKLLAQRQRTRDGLANFSGISRRDPNQGPIIVAAVRPHNWGIP